MSFPTLHADIVDLANGHPTARLILENLAEFYPDDVLRVVRALRSQGCVGSYIADRFGRCYAEDPRRAHRRLIVVTLEPRQ